MCDLFFSMMLTFVLESIQ